MQQHHRFYVFQEKGTKHVFVLILFFQYPQTKLIPHIIVFN